MSKRGRRTRENPSCRLLLAAALAAGCGGSDASDVVITFPGSAVGAEAEVLRRQLARFMAAHPEVRVVQQQTPDAADQRHQLYVQWLNARAGDPDILQLDIIWTAEFAAAGWILPLDGLGVDERSFFPATVEANRWNGKLYALPWFVDMGMLYWRTDLLDAAPGTFDELSRVALEAVRSERLPYGFVWQGARYEGLVPVFLEFLVGFGGGLMDEAGQVTVDSEAAVRALTYLRDLVQGGGSPQATLTWHEEEVRFAFQNGQSLLMRNWPYAYSLLGDREESRVAGSYAVASMPAEPGGRPAATLGGSQLAINALTEHPEAAFELIDFLTSPEQMLERARVVGQLPSRVALYDDPRLAEALAMPVEEARDILETAVARPVTPVYTELSQILQVRLHRALTGQESPAAALESAAREMRELLVRVELQRAQGDMR